MTPSRRQGPGPETGSQWVTAVVAEFGRVLDGAANAGQGTLMGLLLELHRGNIAQWDLEDAARRPGAGDGEVAQAKREIDALNSNRHRLIEEVDAAVDREVHQEASAPLSTESPAMALDRLSVLAIRVHHTEAACRLGETGEARYSPRLPGLYEQLASLEEALGVLLQEVVDGKRRFAPYRSLKLYGS